jgi:hypothetical protein
MNLTTAMLDVSKGIVAVRKMWVRTIPMAVAELLGFVL